MGRSYLFSLLIHSVLLLLFLGLSTHSATPPPLEPTVVVSRPIALERPSIPKLTAGKAIEPGPVNPVSPAPPPPKATKTAPRPVPTTSEKKQSPAPRLTLPEPGYPTRPQNERSMKSDGQGQAGGPDPVDLDGHERTRNRQAIPYYHPAVSLAGLVGRDWLLVKFEIEASGQFRVEMLEGTGDIHRDARALNILRTWKWLPMRIDGEDLASVEIVRLFRRDVPEDPGI